MNKRIVGSRGECNIFQYNGMNGPLASREQRNSEEESWISLYENLLTSGDRSDILIVAGEGSNRREFPLHKFIFVVRCPGFISALEIMEDEHLNRQLDDMVNNCPKLVTTLDRVGIKIAAPSADPKVFQYLSEYLYLFKFKNEEEISNGELLLLQDIKHEFQPAGMIQKCLHILQKRFNVDNIIGIYEDAKILTNDEVVAASLEFILRHGSSVLKSEGFSNLSEATLIEIISNDDLNCSELVVCEAAKRWAIAECNRKNGNEESSSENPIQLQEVSLSIRKHIRFPLLNVQDFVNNSALLTPEEIASVTEYFTSKTQTSNLNENEEPTSTCIFKTTSRSKRFFVQEMQDKKLFPVDVDTPETPEASSPESGDSACPSTSNVTPTARSEGDSSSSSSRRSNRTVKVKVSRIDAARVNKVEVNRETEEDQNNGEGSVEIEDQNNEKNWETDKEGMIENLNCSIEIKEQLRQDPCVHLKRLRLRIVKPCSRRVVSSFRPIPVVDLVDSSDQEQEQSAFRTPASVRTRSGRSPSIITLASSSTSYFTDYSTTTSIWSSRLRSRPRRRKRRPRNKSSSSNQYRDKLRSSCRRGCTGEVPDTPRHLRQRTPTPCKRRCLKKNCRRRLMQIQD